MYFIAVVLPEDLDKKILEYKKWMADKYGNRVGLKSPSHITIIPPFWMEPGKEEELKKDIDSISTSHLKFVLCTDNFSAFKPRTIFIAVEENDSLNALKKTADHFFHNKDYKIKAENRPFHPHITIATRDLHKKDFADAWPHFETKSFSEAFQANGLSLLKHNGSTWDVVYTSAFGA